MRKSATYVVLACLLLTGCAASIEQQQSAYRTWYEGVKELLDLGQHCTAAASDMLTAYASDVYGSYEAYAGAKQIRDILAGLWTGKLDPKLPSELSSGRQKSIADAVSAFKAGNANRIAALESLMAYFDSPSPSKLEGFSEKLETAHTHFMAGLQQLAAIESELRLR